MYISSREKLIKRNKENSPEALNVEEKRKNERLKETDEIVTTIIGYGKEMLPKKNIPYNYSKDISLSGIKIQGNVLLPVNTFLQIDLTLKGLNEIITVFGIVKWSKTIIENESYDAGVEFVDTPGETIRKFQDYISWKQNFRKLNPVGVPFGIFTKFNKYLR
ncbi:MAG: PilZ domain-containing protein [Smithella sp.]